MSAFFNTICKLVRNEKVEKIIIKCEANLLNLDLLYEALISSDVSVFIDGLDLSDNELNETHIKALSKVASVLPNLKRLTLKYNNFGDSIIELFEYIPGIEYLNVDQCSIQLDHDGSLDMLPNLREFSASYNNLGSIGIQLLIDAMPGVQTVDVQHNYIHGLLRLKNIKVLYVNGNRLDGRAINQILRSKTLKFADFRHNPGSDDAIVKNSNQTAIIMSYAKKRSESVRAGDCIIVR